MPMHTQEILVCVDFIFLSFKTRNAFYIKLINCMLSSTFWWLLMQTGFLRASFLYDTLLIEKVAGVLIITLPGNEVTHQI
jgi:hypothetical protein